MAQQQRGENPTVHEAWANVMRDMGAVGKDGWNDQQKFKFRGVDQLYGALAAPMRKHGVFLVPEVLDKHYDTFTSGNGKTHMHAVVTIKYTIYGPAGDQFSGSTVGEALDLYDKATSKAMSMALKSFLFPAAMIPMDESSVDDGDRHTPDVQYERAPAQQQRPAVQQKRGQSQSPTEPMEMKIRNVATALVACQSLEALNKIMKDTTPGFRKELVPADVFTDFEGNQVTISRLGVLVKEDMEAAKTSPADNGWGAATKGVD